MAAGLAVTAAALLASGAGDTERARGHPVADPARGRGAVRLVAAPVRIADGATVRLLRPGDQVDVIAAEESGTARVVASGARVTKVPHVPSDAGPVPSSGNGFDFESDSGDRFGAGHTPASGGTLVVLSVPRETAARLAGAGVTARLAVTLC